MLPRMKSINAYTPLVLLNICCTFSHALYTSRLIQFTLINFFYASPVFSCHCSPLYNLKCKGNREPLLHKVLATNGRLLILKGGSVIFSLCLDLIRKVTDMFHLKICCPSTGSISNSRSKVKMTVLISMTANLYPMHLLGPSIKVIKFGQMPGPSGT